ncbi:MAG TPA: RHS repeat-associated core domain-containing protein, partial [Candidatus Binatia bacterium]|nr:RHS repeat-associated core domain-containing protein [Candidatus Binatia bacterium]
HAETDLMVRGIVPIKLVRTYYSGKGDFIGSFGVGSHLAGYNYRVQVARDANNRVILAPNTEIFLDTGNDSGIGFTNPDGGSVFVNDALLGTTGDTLTLNVDANGQLLNATLLNLEQEKLHFNAEGWLTASEDRNGNRLDFTRNNTGQLQSITEASTGRNIHFTYGLDGLITQAADSAGRTVSYAYSSNKELVSVTNPENQTLRYTWDASHRIVSKTDYNGVTKMTNEYGPTGAVVKQSQADGAVIEMQAYSTSLRKVIDPNGHVTTYLFNEQGLPVEMEDPLGNVTETRYSPTMFTQDTSGRFVETEDPLGRISRVELNERNLPTTVTDPLGRRTNFSNGSATKSYFYSGLNMLSDGASRFLHGAGIDEPLQMDNGAASLSYLQDHLGSSSQLLDALNGASQARYDYESYGLLEGDIANPQPANVFTYTGREDDGTGLYYYRARYYDPEIERFISADPLGFQSGDINLYRYVAGNPVNFADANGLEPVNVGGRNYEVPRYCEGFSGLAGWLCNVFMNGYGAHQDDQAGINGMRCQYSYNLSPDAQRACINQTVNPEINKGQALRSGTTLLGESGQFASGPIESVPSSIGARQLPISVPSWKPLPTSQNNKTRPCP